MISSARPKKDKYTIGEDRRVRWLYKPIVWILCLTPLIWFSALLIKQDLTANPAEFYNRYFGKWAIRMLWLSLAVTPFRIITGWKHAVRFRRLLGLFAFFYLTLHISSYVILDQNFNWFAIYNDIIKRFYITMGLAAFVILTALAITSYGPLKKILGGKNWSTLHKGVYIASILGGIHFFMMRKGLQIEPLIYAGALIILFAVRFGYHLNKRLLRHRKT